MTFADLTLEEKEARIEEQISRLRRLRRLLRLQNEHKPKAQLDLDVEEALTHAKKTIDNLPSQ